MGSYVPFRKFHHLESEVFHRYILTAIYEHNLFELVVVCAGGYVADAKAIQGRCLPMMPLSFRAQRKLRFQFNEGHEKDLSTAISASTLQAEGQ